jgi:hypothetical protein
MRNLLLRSLNNRRAPIVALVAAVALPAAGYTYIFPRNPSQAALWLGQLIDAALWNRDDAGFTQIPLNFLGSTILCCF